MAALSELGRSPLAFTALGLNYLQFTKTKVLELLGSLTFRTHFTATKFFDPVDYRESQSDTEIVRCQIDEVETPVWGQELQEFLSRNENKNPKYSVGYAEPLETQPAKRKEPRKHDRKDTHQHGVSGFVTTWDVFEESKVCRTIARVSDSKHCSEEKNGQSSYR